MTGPEKNDWVMTDGDSAIRIFDVALAAVLLAILAPVLAGSALAVLLALGRPVLHRSRRVGQGGREYDHVKLRTMEPGPEVGRIFFEQARLGRLGRLLRALHLDELPELVHILRGQMSFVGPRPLPRALLRDLDTTAREQVPPGWTGPAQIWLLQHGRLDKRQQVELDEGYIRQRDLACNLGLLARTLCCLVQPGRPGLDLDPEATAERRAFGQRHKQERRAK